MVRNRGRVRACLFAAACLAALMVGAPAAFAQEEPAVDSGEIVVTAQRRAERSVDVPITVTTLSPEQLETANVQDLTDIATVTPALRFDRQSQFVQPTIRGVGTSITTTGGASNVGIYVDGFYVPNPAGSDFQLMNVESVQVLKGPQGTLFGRNTTGGAILVQTAAPSTETSAALNVSYGRFDEGRGQGYATFGLTDRIAFDVEGLYSGGEGWLHNDASGGTDGDFNIWSIRVGLNADWTDNFSTLLRYQRAETDDARSILTNTFVDNTTNQYIPASQMIGPGAASFAIPGSFTSDADHYNPGENQRWFRSEADIIQLTARLDLGWGALTSYTQHRKEDVDASTDLDQIGMTIFQLGLPVYNETFTQEFLLTSDPGGRLQWTAGLFYLENVDTYVTYVDNALSTLGVRARLGGSSAPSYTYAAYADATYQFADQWYLTGGLRFARDEVNKAYFNPPNGTGVQVRVPDYSDEHLTPRVVLRYEPTDDSSVYLSYTQGYKAGILDVGGATGNVVRPEEIDAIELGYKYDGDRLRFETSAFYYDYRDLQVSLFFAGTAQIINAAKSEIYGLEAQVAYDITDNFSVSFGGAWTHAQYELFEHAPVYLRCPAPINPVGTCDNGQSFYIRSEATGDDVLIRDGDMQRAPEITANLGARYAMPLMNGELALSGNVYYTSDFSFAPSGQQFYQSAYYTLALRAAWTDPSDRYTIALFGDNVTDQRYVTQVQYNNFGIGSTWNSPAVWGVEVGVRY